MVTSTSTPGSMLIDVICLTISEGECKSMTLLWILIWNLSQVLEPSPQGVLRVVILKILVGIRTGPFTRSFCFLAASIKSAHTFSNERTLREVKVILMWWTGAVSCPGFSGFTSFTDAWNVQTDFTTRDYITSHNIKNNKYTNRVLLYHYEWINSPPYHILITFWSR